jgi:hypothetical protein
MTTVVKFAAILAAILVFGFPSPTALANDSTVSTAAIPPRPSAGSVQSSAASSWPVNEMNAPAIPYEGAKWNTASVVTWSIARTPGTADAPFTGYMGSQYETLVQRAFETWAAASGLKFQQVPDSTASDLRLGWGKFDTASTGIVGHTACQALAGEMMPNGIIRLEDPSQDALVSGPGNTLIYSGTTATLYQVTLHEIGHALGLADNDDPNSIMNFEATEQNSTLAGNDIAGIRRLYAASAHSVTALQAATQFASAPRAARVARSIHPEASVQANERARHTVAQTFARR